MRSVTITLEDGSRYEIDASDAATHRSLASYLEAHGFALNTRCGKRGLCKGCEVNLGGKGLVKACQISTEDMNSVEIPGRSRMEHQPQVGDTFRVDIPIAHQPLFEFEEGVRDMAVAIDLGTTTVVVLLIDLKNGAILARAGEFNEQIRYGDNVLTRIEAAKDPTVRDELQKAISSDTIAPLIHSACERAGRPISQLAGGVIAGNTTMLHLLIGEDPTSMGVFPFTPKFLYGRQVNAEDINLHLENVARSLPLHFLPGIAAFIGADIVAGIYATGMMFDEKPSLLVDIGTNGEIVLQHNGKLTACATAAGPAFEGGGLRCGTRAKDGSISQISLTLDPWHIVAEIIGSLPLSRATGICGSAYIDFLADARESGLLNDSGRFDQAVWDKIPTSHKIEEDDERAIRIAGEDGRGNMLISEIDIALILQAKAAIGAGIEMLLANSGTSANELDKLYLAGGFGMHLDVSHAIQMGLLPGVQVNQVEVVGNTSLAGAMLALIDHTILDEMEDIRNDTKIIELNVQENFEDCYIDHLMLP